MKIQRQKLGFTLAEVLITLGIIGVVAALTLPNLIANYQEKVLVNLAKKNYSIVQNALNRYNTDNDSIGDYTTLMDYRKSDLEIATELSKYFDGANLCQQGNKNNCNFQNYKIAYTKAINDGNGKNAYGTPVSKQGTFFLKDGSFISINRETTEAGCHFKWTKCNKDENGNFAKNEDGTTQCYLADSSRCGRITVDTNGLKKGPNRYGSDVFNYWVLPNKVYATSETEGDLGYILKYDKIQPYKKYNAGEFKK